MEVLNYTFDVSDTSWSMKRYLRLHEMSVWLNLVPRLHLAGADNIFPQHNAFKDDPSLFTGVVRPASFSHGYQVNREYLSGTTAAAPPATTCVPLTAAAASLGATSGETDSSLVRLDGVHAYQHVIYLTVGIGAILLAVNVWFLICFMFCRSKIGRCVGLEPPMATLPNKDLSCDTELMGMASSSSIQSLRDYRGSRRHSNNAEALRLLHESVSGPGAGNDSDDRSTSSGVSSSRSRGEKSRQSGPISYISSSKPSYNNHKYDQMALAMALANTEAQYPHVSQK